MSPRTVCGRTTVAVRRQAAADVMSWPGRLRLGGSLRIMRRDAADRRCRGCGADSSRCGRIVAVALWLHDLRLLVVTWDGDGRLRLLAHLSVQCDEPRRAHTDTRIPIAHPPIHAYYRRETTASHEAHARMLGSSAQRRIDAPNPAQPLRGAPQSARPERPTLRWVRTCGVAPSMP